MRNNDEQQSVQSSQAGSQRSSRQAGDDEYEPSYFVGDSKTAEKYGLLNGTAIYSIPGTSKVVLSSTDPAVAINLVLHASDSFSRLDVPDGYGVVLRETSMSHAHDTSAEDLPERLQTLWSMGSLAIVTVPEEDIQQVAMCRHSIQIKIMPKMRAPPERAVFDEKRAANSKRLGAFGNACSTTTKESAIVALNRAKYTEWMKGISGVIPIIVNGQSSTITSRYSKNTEQINLAAAWLQEQCVFLGLQVEVQTFDVGNQFTSGYMGNMKNIICKKHPTSGATSSVFVVGAHYDSTAGKNDRLNNAPGAVDNGSGAAGVLAIAQALQLVALEQTVHFVFFGAEEQGVYGSQHYVTETTRQARWTVSGAAIMDMIGYSNRYFGVTVEYQGGSSGTPLAQNAFLNFYSYDVMGEYYGDASGKMLTSRYMYSPWGSDHMSFILASVPAFLAIQREDINYDYYHSVLDTEATMNYDQAMGILRMMVGTVYDNTCSPEVAATSPPTPAPPMPTPPPAPPVSCANTRGIRPVEPYTCNSEPKRMARRASP